MRYRAPCKTATEPTTAVLAWHWLREDRCLAYPPHTPVEPGQTLTHDGPLALCESGLHASVRALDALKYAPGSIVCRVRVGGTVIHGDDKLVASERTVLWLADATTTLHEFACWCAEQALERERAAGREPDPRSLAAITAKRAWLRGEVTNDQLTAAGAAARTAAGAAAGAAARAAARDAAGAAARAAARDAAWAAAWAAAWVATWGPAWDAAGVAAWVAAGDAQNTELERRLVALNPEMEALA